jgi:hypothetical protein
MKIDPHKTFRLVEERLKSERDPRRRRVLETVLAHMKAEANADLAALMATMAPDPRYSAWGTEGSDHGPKGWKAVEKFYRDFIESDCHRLEFEIDRLLVDDHGVLTEGMMRIAYPGRVLRQMGRPVDDPDAFYLYESRMAIVWPMDEQARVIGEDSYVAGDGFARLRKLSPDELPPESARY